VKKEEVEKETAVVREKTEEINRLTEDANE
jgi:hypothetical protein